MVRRVKAAAGASMWSCRLCHGPLRVRDDRHAEASSLCFDGLRSDRQLSGGATQEAMGLCRMELRVLRGELVSHWTSPVRAPEIFGGG